MFIFSLLMTIANASPAGPALGGVSLGSPLPSGWFRAVDSNGQTLTNTWIRDGAVGTVVGAMPGKFQAETCKGLVQSISFYPISGYEKYAHKSWSYTLMEAGFISTLPYNWCTDKEGYMCQTFWTNESKNRTIHMMWTDDGTPSLTEWLDKSCTEGI